MTKQPSPSDMLEELADKVIGHMDRLAFTSFRNALDEMIDFHRFLIEAYETRDGSGQAVSFAQIGDWGALHKDWIREYRRLFDRATRYIGQEDDFIRTLARVPFQLLPADGRQSAPAVTTSLLDLFTILAHRLEDWVTRRRIYDRKAETSEPTIPRLAGSDQSAYEEVVRSLVGTWEHALKIVDQMYAWRQRELAPAEQWQRYAASWPFLQQHLQNSAYLLAAAAFNEDEIGAKYYAEMLLRWFDGLRHALEDGSLLKGSLLTPDILGKAWNEVLTSLAPMEGRPSVDQPSPPAVFSAIVQNALADTVVICAGVILGWFGERRQGTDIAPRIVSRLLSDTGAESDTHPTRQETGLVPFFFHLIRIYSAGERFEEQGYGHWLDRLVARLDLMTEKPVVAGRLFTPSTRHEREDLLYPWLACLIAQTPTEGDANVVTAVARLADRENAFAYGDRSLRKLLDDLRKLKSGLSPKQLEYLSRCATALNPAAQTREQMQGLSSILDKIINVIEMQRNERLRTRPIDEGELNSIREEVEKALTSDSGGIDVLEGFSILREPVKTRNHEYTLAGIQKGYLASPEMAEKPVNILESVTERVKLYAARLVWEDLYKHPRQWTDVRDEASYLMALTNHALPMLHAERRPVLLVRGWNDPPWIRDWFSWSAGRPAGLQVRRKSEIHTNLYIGTVNDIDVYQARLDEGVSLLFRSDLLSKVRYGVTSDGNVVDV